MHLPNISAKLGAAIAPPLTTVVTAAILTGTLDKQSAAVLASILIAAVLGYQVPHTTKAKVTNKSGPLGSSVSHFSTSTTVAGGGAALTYVPSVQPIMGGTMGPSGPGNEPDDTGDDGDDALPPELEHTTPAENPPDDEIDLPHGQVQP